MEGSEGTPLVYVGVLAFSIVAPSSSRGTHGTWGDLLLLGPGGGVSAVTVAYAELGFAVPGSLPAVAAD